MDDLKALTQIALEQVESLAAVRVSKLDWNGLETLPREALARSLYLQGAQDALALLDHLLELKAEA